MARPRPPQDFLIGTLAYALYWVDESLQLSIQAAGWPRMSRNRSMIMVCVTAGINQPSQIASSLGISRQAVHQLLQDMVAENIVELTTNPADSRAKIVSFCKGSEKMRACAEAAMVEIERQLAGRLGGTTFNQLQRALNSDWGPPVEAAPR